MSKGPWTGVQRQPLYPVVTELRQQMQARGFTQAHLSRRSGYSEDAITGIFRGNNPRLATIESMANAMGMTLTIKERNRK